MITPPLPFFDEDIYEFQSRSMQWLRERVDKCPCCSNPSDHLFIDVDDEKGSTLLYYIHCGVCLTGTDKYDTIVEALKSWNNLKG
jgi:hypothetical protein